jgi:hypothetical protein
VSFDLASKLDIYPIDRLKIYSTISKTLREAPLIYSNWSYGSTNLPVEKYTSFYEANELFFLNTIAPETERKFETGLNVEIGRFLFEFSYFNNLTGDFIAPVKVADRFEMQNIASIKNYGTILNSSYTDPFPHGSWGIDLKWTKYNSIVTHISSAESRIPLAGFESAQTALSSGEPVGAIYGATYLRDATGNRIIGSDGFPLEDPNLKMIGNPIPDWNLAWSAFCNWKKLEFSFLFDFKKGGQVWNGTASMLDYLGRSSNTGNHRNIANYIFEGVDVNGNINQIPVNFYDPAQPLSANRWVRYGSDGVGEDYIEDASWIRLSEVMLSYRLKQTFRSSVIKDFKVSLMVRNVFVITPYSGVDPSAGLFGYSSGAGLDLFNVPSTRNYSAQITIKL